MSSELLDKLVIRYQRTELHIQRLNAELSLKELEMKEISKQIQKIKKTNYGVMNK